jgi:hypothetical protein
VLNLGVDLSGEIHFRSIMEQERYACVRSWEQVRVEIHLCLATASPVDPLCSTLNCVEDVVSTGHGIFICK